MQVRVENSDVQQQRENLYQKLEALRGQGILLSPNMTIVSTAPIPASGGASEDCESTAASPPPPSSIAPSPTPSAVDLGRRKTSNLGVQSVREEPYRVVVNL